MVGFSYDPEKPCEVCGATSEKFVRTIETEMHIETIDTKSMNVTYCTECGGIYELEFTP